MNQEEDIFYCKEPICKDPTKVITSLAVLYKNHYGHEWGSIAKLRKELQEQDTNSNPLQPDPVDEKEELLNFIDAEVNKLKKSFLITIQNFGDYLKMFVNENLISLNKTKLLFKAVIENNLEQITLHQDHLEFLKKDNEFFQDQKEILELVRQQISSTINSTSDKIASLDKLNLPKPSLVKIFTWSNTNKHNRVTVEGKVAKQTSGGDDAILLENRLSFQRVQILKLKMIMSEFKRVQLHICDLKTIKTKCPSFAGIHKDGFGAYSHKNNGEIYGSDTYGQGATMSFTFAVGDILELQWDGPKKQFTTHKVNSGEKFVFDVKFDINAELYFAVTLYHATVEIM